MAIDAHKKGNNRGVKNALTGNECMSLNFQWADLEFALGDIELCVSLLKRGEQLHKTEYEYFDDKDSQAALSNSLENAR